METLEELAGFVYALQERFAARVTSLPPAARREQELGVLLAIQARLIELIQRLQSQGAADVGRR